MDQPRQDDDEEDERDRRTANIFLVVFGTLVIAIGIWLVNAMVDQRQLDNCIAQGRRNCGAPADVMPR